MSDDRLRTLRTTVVEGSIAFQMRRFAAAQVNDCGLQILNLSQAAARLAGGFAIAAPAELLEPAIQNALDDGGFVELEQVRHLPGMTRAVLRTLRKIWAADFDLAAAGGAGHRRIAEMSLIEARLRSTLASGCDNAARPARSRLETSCGVHHRGDRSRTPMDSSTRPSMLSSPPPIPSDSDVDRRRASCSHSRNIASFSSRDS